MKTYQHPLAHLYERRKQAFGFGSASLFQSLLTGSVIGVLAALIGILLNAVPWPGSAWHPGAITAAAVELVVVTILVTLVIEGRRKRSIRRTLELAFLNHHIRNAIMQVSVAQHVADSEKQERLVREAVDRISEALFRIANSADLTGLSLDVDLQGIQLTHAGQAREQEEQQRAG
jgi:hypothetical protein